MTRTSLFFLLFAWATVVCAQDAPSTSAKQYINLTRATSGSPLPFSDAVLVGRTLYIAGRIGLDPKTGTGPADIDAELGYLLDGIGEVLSKADMTMDDWVSVHVFCTDLSLYGKFNDAYRA